MDSTPRRSVLFAFFLIVLLAGANAVAVRFTVAELAPFWGAFLRFGTAALIFWAVVIFRRLPLPKGRALAGVLLYGFLSIGASYAFIYWGIRKIPAGMSQVLLALVPLVTFFAAVLHGLESFRWRGLLGAALAVFGIGFAFFEGPSGHLPVAPLLAILAAAVCIAEASIVVKIFPRSDPFVTNALGMTTGGLSLAFFSRLVGESWKIPVRAATWASILYLILIGSVIVFYLFLYVLSHWSASATSYQFVLFPFVTVVLSAWLAGETIGPGLLIGGNFVVAGVWIGAFSAKPSARDRAVPLPAVSSPAAEPPDPGS
jgi:drug/metabolite transporter (DMT)-like permease